METQTRKYLPNLLADHMGSDVITNAQVLNHRFFKAASLDPVNPRLVVSAKSLWRELQQSPL